MTWFLRLFPQYREMEQHAREAGEQAIRFQDQVSDLMQQNKELREEAKASRAAQDYAQKSLANLGIQMQFGGLPPYREAFYIPERVPTEPEPVATNRVQARDAVNEARREFLENLRSL